MTPLPLIARAPVTALGAHPTQEQVGTVALRALRSAQDGRCASAAAGGVAGSSGAQVHWFGIEGAWALGSEAEL